MNVNAINREVHKYTPATLFSTKKAIDSEGFQPILDSELDKLNSSGSIYQIEQPKIVLAGILGIINGVKSLNEDNPKLTEEVKAFGFDKIQSLIEDALRQTVIKSGRGQTR